MGMADPDPEPEGVGKLTVELAKVGRRAKQLLDEVERAVVGKRAALELILLGMLADGHVLIEDYPGLAKTVIARSFAQVLGLGFARIQFTPDLMPADVTGSSVFDQRNNTFDFRPGPVFTNLLLADEINRTPPKTQAALLEAMQERQVTVEGATRRLERPFVVIATQNPIEYEGTYPLPEAQLDRFLLRARVGYPNRDDEWRILSDRVERASDEVALDKVVDAAGLPAGSSSPPTTSRRWRCRRWRTGWRCSPSCGCGGSSPTRSSARSWTRCPPRHPRTCRTEGPDGPDVLAQARRLRRAGGGRAAGGAGVAAARARRVGGAVRAVAGGRPGHRAGARAGGVGGGGPGPRGEG